MVDFVKIQRPLEECLDTLDSLSLVRKNGSRDDWVKSYQCAYREIDRERQLSSSQ